MRRLTFVAALLLAGGCDGTPTEPAVPAEPDFSVLAGEWEVMGRAATEEWFTRFRANVSIANVVTSSTRSLLDDWVVYTAVMPMEYSYQDTLWSQAAGGTRTAHSDSIGGGGGLIEVTASLPRRGRGPPLLHLHLRGAPVGSFGHRTHVWPLPRRPVFIDQVHLYATELNPQVLSGQVSAPADTMGWQMRRP